MNYYTSTIPLPLAEKLKENGMPLMTSVSISIVEDKPVVDENGEQWYRPTYAEVFDWLIEKGVSMNFSTRPFFIVWSNDGKKPSIYQRATWHEAANAAIEKALTLI